MDLKKSFLTISLLSFVMSLVAQNPVEQLLNNHRANSGVPAIALGVVDQGELIAEYYLGQRKKDSLSLGVDSNTVFSSGSVSKLMTTTAVLCLVRDQQLSLADGASIILGYDIDNLAYPNRPITVGDLLTHRSSIRDEVDTLNNYVNDCSQKPDLDTIVYNYLNVRGAKYNIGSFFITSPGQTQAYSNMNFVVLAAIVEKVSGISFEAYCQQEIFGPLCMSASFWWPGDIPDAQFAFPHTSFNGNTFEIPRYCLDIFPTGQFSARLRDFLLFSRAYVKGSSPILSDSLIDLALSPYYFDQITGANQGLGWFNFTYNGADWWGHNGFISGVNANFFWNWKDDQGIVLLENQDQPTDDLLFDLLDEASLFTGNGPALGCSSLGHAPKANALMLPNIYPNPTQDVLNLNPPIKGSLRIVNAQGQVVYASSHTTKELYVGHLLPGVYSLITEEGLAISFIKK